MLLFPPGVNPLPHGVGLWLPALKPVTLPLSLPLSLGLSAGLG